MKRVCQGKGKTKRKKTTITTKGVENASSLRGSSSNLQQQQRKKKAKGGFTSPRSERMGRYQTTTQHCS